MCLCKAWVVSLTGASFQTSLSSSGHNPGCCSLPWPPPLEPGQWSAERGWWLWSEIKLSPRTLRCFWTSCQVRVLGVHWALLSPTQRSVVTPMPLCKCYPWRPHGFSPPGSSVHGLLQARILQWVAISFSRGSSQLRGRTPVSYVAGRFFTVWATRQGLGLCL